MVGVDAKTLAERAGFSVPDDVTVLIAERKYVSAGDPFMREMLCPVLTYYVEDDWMDACEKCIELLLNEKNGHTLVIHSTDKDVIAQFALKKPVGRVLVNTPAAFGGMGATTNLFPSMTLGSGSAGYGFTSDNVSPLNLIYTRKVGYGVRSVDAIGIDITNEATSSLANNAQKKVSDVGGIETIQRILQEAIGALDTSKDN
jgi:acyl-CoA reductase-like NAD-dependent aldehyde dehydrogenase